MSHTRMHAPTEKINNSTLYAPRYEETFLPLEKKASDIFAPSALLHYEEAFLPSSQNRPHYQQL